MLRGLWLAAALLFSTCAWAQRTIPADMDVAVLKKVELPYITVSSGGFSWIRLLTFGIADGNSATLQVSRFARIKDENNRFLVMGRLTVQTGKTIAVQQNSAGVVQEIWLLTDDEVAAYQEKAADSGS
ncbi:hypothetical protein [Neisseria perflava]|uniref:hypothetical protein n=1 Tax=Neisseria perflava TaxID=33053 RepID=UPI0020A11735|nr:hypothetical protein [Neisseria perflava]MCP1659952.1 hypothetical protein [Neisseria perflava]MCP1772200.1 hypothetical protein [Neisseria perflava]